MNTPITEKLGSARSVEPSQGLLPPFSTAQYSHLPTPQSPNNFDRYIHGTTQSPATLKPHSASLTSNSAIHRPLPSESHPTRFQSNPQQCITPDSSPHASHITLPLDNDSSTPRNLVLPPSNEMSTPKQHSSVKLISHSIEASRLRMSTPSPPLESYSRSSVLSSPFVAKLLIAGDKAKAFSIEAKPAASPDLPSSIPPFFLSRSSTSSSIPVAGGELERIRQSVTDDRVAQLQEAEKHRPEYLKRTKRTLSETDPTFLDNGDSIRDHDGSAAVGIMESPNKGRRLKLFQETSEESFEESLMAGGYGRYRTADWVRQPQPILLPPSAIAGSSNIVSLLEEVEDQPPTEKELKKRKRLAAFKTPIAPSTSKLSAVELEGKGRVLLDITSEEQGTPSSPEPTPNKKRVNNRKKKKNLDTSNVKKPYSILEGLDDPGEKPNWPDSEFPWRLRTEERIELVRAEEEERLRVIERFLDRDSDDEGDLEPNLQLPQSELSLPGGQNHEKMSERPFPLGRGKTVPLMVYSQSTPNPPKRIIFPTDPADARAALMSKRSVRALSYRQQKRQRELDDEDDDEIVCICDGKDDGRELVQCDACQTWYHLQCIGIHDISELGREEDPWFCRRCVARSPSPPSRETHMASEPIFVPTDNEPNVRRPLDASFFPPGLQESPSWASVRTPRTPTRSGTLSDFSHSWSDSSRPGPSTPQQSNSTIRIYSSPLDTYSRLYDESPFDPTSTPSRGIKFQAPFTPKNNVWPPRTSLFHTPSKQMSHAPSSVAVASGFTLDHAENDGASANDFFDRPIAYDVSPVRQSRLQDSVATNRIIQSPPRPMTSYLEESPVVRQVNHQNLERGRHRGLFEGGNIA